MSSTENTFPVTAVNGPFHGQVIGFVADRAAVGYWDLDWEACPAGTYLYRKTAGSTYAWYGGFNAFPKGHPRAGEVVA